MQTRGSRFESYGVEEQGVRVHCMRGRERLRNLVETAYQRIHDELLVRGRRWHRIIFSGDEILPKVSVEFRPARKERVQEFPRIHRPHHRGHEPFNGGRVSYRILPRWLLPNVRSLGHLTAVVDVAGAVGHCVEPGICYSFVCGGELKVNV